MMADRYFRGGGTSLASTFASMRSIREALGFMGAHAHATRARAAGYRRGDGGGDASGQAEGQESPAIGGFAAHYPGWGNRWGIN
jgi:hypothetical protein